MLRPILMTTLIAAAAPATSTLPNQPVDTIDIQRHAGQLHEIAHLPMFFQRKCMDSITATYTLQLDGTIQVRNACRTKGGSTEASDGVAKKVPGKPAALKVRFAPPHWLSWLPSVWADYWVVDLEPDYQWAVVGGPSRKYMWVLSRCPSIDRALFEQLRERGRERHNRSTSW